MPLDAIDPAPVPLKFENFPADEWDHLLPLEWWDSMPCYLEEFRLSNPELIDN